MGFLAPWFLGGLAALGVPVFVHLLRKHVTIPRPVSSLMFFERGTQSSTRHRRVRGLLFFFFRASFFLFVVVAVVVTFLWLPAPAPTPPFVLLVVHTISHHPARHPHP